MYDSLAISSSSVERNKIQTAKLTSIIDDVIETPDGDNLNRQDLSDLLESDATIVIAEDLRARALLGGLIILDQDGTAEIVGVVLAPEARGRLIGHKLMEHAIETCRQLGFAKITLEIRWTDDGPPQAAYRLYKAHGFQMVPGVKVTPIGWTYKKRHLWRNPDPGGFYRSRMMELILDPARSVPDNGSARDAG